MTDTPMPAPTPGADEFTVKASAVSNEMVETAILALFAEWNHPNSINPHTQRRYKEPWSTRLWFRFMRAGLNAVIPTGHVVVPATAVPDAAAIRRLLEISQLAQGLLFMRGSFGAPWPLDDDLNIGNRLVNALEAITLPHDWERTDAWLAQLAAGDAARTEEGG